MSGDAGVRIAFLTHTGAPSGAELAFARLAGALGRRGFRPIVVMTEAGSLVDVLTNEGVASTVVETAFVSRKMTIGTAVTGLVAGACAILRTGWRLGDVVRDLDAEVVIAESSKALLMGIVASRRARIPLVWHVHDRVSRDYFGPLLFLLVRILGLGASGFLANSFGTLATLWTARRPASVCYPGVVLSATLPRAPQRQPAEVRLVMVGRLTEWKGQDLVLEAMALTESKACIRFIGGTHFGEEPYAEALTERAIDLGIADRVEFVGHTDNPFQELANADVAIHYSRLSEPFGQVVVEAMASGCAVLAAGAGGPTEIITDGVDGLLVAPGCPAELAIAIDQVVADTGLRERLATAARVRAQDFAIERSAAVAGSLFHQVVPRNVLMGATP